MTGVQTCALPISLIKYNGTDKNLVIPDNFDGIAVENIGDNAFNSKELLEVKIPAGVKKIGKRAFSHNSLSKVVVQGKICDPFIETCLMLGDKAFMVSKSGELNVIRERR